MLKERKQRYKILHNLNSRGGSLNSRGENLNSRSRNLNSRGGKIDFCSKYKNSRGGKMDFCSKYKVNPITCEESSSGAKCPKCSRSEFWKTIDNRLKRRNCRYIFTPRPNPRNVSNKISNEVIFGFLLEHQLTLFYKRVYISKYKLLKALACYFSILRIERKPNGIFLSFLYVL